MLLSETAEVIWNSRNKKHYVSLGYEFTRMGDTFIVSVDDLTVGSQAVVSVKCDYCGEIYLIAWHKRVAAIRNRFLKSDCCGNIDCLERKARDSVIAKYGGYTEMYFSCNDSRTETNIERYGSENPFGSDLIKERIAETNLERYGVPYTQQSEVVRNKTVATCRERYGVDNYVELFKGKYIRENSPNWKGGVEHSRVERATYEYAQWRKSVFIRDQYRCQCCGVKNGEAVHAVELNAHHIQNWRDYEELRYDIDNGICLCSDCHTNFHRKYGKRNNTRQQLEEFLCLDKKVC